VPAAEVIIGVSLGRCTLCSLIQRIYSVYEYGLILSGTLRANVGFDSFELGPGDSIAFDSSVPHEYWNKTRQDVRAIWVVVHSEPGRA
jgi:mannose-6-phosphate isomerase-like protein (cupin superfamily)